MKPFFCSLIFFSALVVQAETRLPSVISDHMVLQSGASVPIWGWDEPGTEVRVSVGGQTQTAKAGVDGKWTVKLNKVDANEKAQTLTIQGSSAVAVHDVLVGEVWLASGQSNMEMQVRGKMHGSIDHAEEEIAAAKHPQLRMFLPKENFVIYEVAAPPASPAKDQAGSWFVCSPETVENFSACGYFFARELQEKLKVPVGIVTAAVGGTPVEAWTSLEPQQAEPSLKPLLEDWQKRLTNYDAQRDHDTFMTAKAAWLKQRSTAVKAGQPAPKAPTPFKNLEVMRPAALFNGVIAPLIPYAVHGVIWYQGERNAAGPFTGLYGRQLETLIQDWRRHWQSDLYFAWVQLPHSLNEQKLPSEPKGWGVMVREGMRKALSVPNTGMAVTIELGDPKQGHPTNKADFAHRLALVALHDVYHQSEGGYCGPLFKACRTEGGKMVLSFTNGAGLKAAAGDLKGFAMAGEDQKFVWATAEIVNDEVVVSAPKIDKPAAVRYGWASNPTCNLFNGAGLPASPFRTDDWP